MMHLAKEGIENFSALGGLGLYGIMAVSSLILGRYALSLRLFVALAALYGITIIIRALYFKERPDKRPYKNIVEKIDASSFPSLHSERASALALLVGLSSGSILLTVFLIVSAVLVAFTRVFLKRHDKWDVTAGLIIGAAVAIALLAIPMPF